MLATRLIILAPLSAYILHMATIGVYDSGIGGLTTAKIILDRFAGNNLFYLADNLNHPFGNKDESELKKIVEAGLDRLCANSDVAVIACNTASSIFCGDAIRLLPPIRESERYADSTLLMATERTLATLKPNGFQIADTKELATLVERQADGTGGIDMDALYPYLENALLKFKGVKRVILGCSHYPYCKKQISKILGDVKFSDGNENLCAELKKHISPHPEYASKITFAFTSNDETKKYQNILRLLMNPRP